MQELIEIIHIIGASQGIFLGAVLISKRENRHANNCISLLILAIAVSMLGRYFMMKGHFTIGHYMGAIALPSLALHGPLTYLYTSLLTSRTDKLHKKDLLHGIHALILFLIVGALAIIFPVPEVNTFAEFRAFMETMFSRWPGRIIIIMVGSCALSGLIYTVAAWIVLTRYSRNVKEFFSDIERVNLRWLRVLLGLLLVKFFTWNIVYWLHTLGVLKNRGGFFAGGIFAVLTIFLTAFFAIRQPDIFRETHTMVEEIEEIKEIKDPEEENGERNGAKYEKHSLDEVTGKRYLHQLQEYMEKEKPYLNDALTLKDLAEELSISSHHLSIVINLYQKQNFYNFINEYRVEEVKQRLAEPVNKEENILTIAYGAGFNSKSTFNNIFKKNTGTTPTEYRKKVIGGPAGRVIGDR
ncbi:MAG: helix-turn-helix transcriptional regulator [bacterium]|nr:helix-turn-helix transcriptional regulator [bacterium]